MGRLTLSAAFAILGSISALTMVASGLPQGPCEIRGTVVGSDSHIVVPVAAVTLVIPEPIPGEGDQPGNGTKRTATADEHGAFLFDGLAPALYRISASPGPYSSQYLPMTPAEAVSVDLTQCRQIGTVDVPLTAGAVIAGRVTDGQGTPLVRVHVTATIVTNNAANEESGIGVDTDDSGQYRFFGLAPNKYRIDASPYGDIRDNAGPAGFVRTFYFGTTDAASAQLVPVERGQQLAGIDIQLVRSGVGAIDGRVTDSTGAYRARCIVMTTRGVAVFTDAEGRFHLANIPYGTLEVSAHCMGLNATPEEGHTTVMLADHVAVVAISTAPKN